MRIINNVSFTVEKVTNVKPAQVKSVGNVSVPKYDNAIISPIGKDLCFIKRFLKETPDVREDKVREIKEKIDTNTYKVDTNMLADKLLGIEHKN